MKIRNDVVLAAVDRLTTPELGNQTTWPAVTDAVRVATGVEVPRAAVKAAIEELASAGDVVMEPAGKSFVVRRISKERRAAWTTSDSLVEQLSKVAGAGISVVKTFDNAMATFTLTLEGAESLAAALATLAKVNAAGKVAA